MFLNYLSADCLYKKREILWANDTKRNVKIIKILVHIESSLNFKFYYNMLQKCMYIKSMILYKKMLQQ